MNLERLHAPKSYSLIYRSCMVCASVERARTSSRPTSSVKAKPSFPSQESKIDEDCQERGRETRSDKCFLISLACFKRFRCFQTRVNSRENTKSKEAEKDSRLLNSQVHLFEQVSFLQLEFQNPFIPGR